MSVIENIHTLTVADFSKLLGDELAISNAECCRFITEKNFDYRMLGARERDEVILKIIKRIDSKQFSIAGKDVKDRWEKGWAENLSQYIKSDYNLTELIPKYVHPDQVCRLYRDYIQPFDSNFEINFFTVLRLHFFSKFLMQASSIYEFGCGPGYNLPVLAKLFPEKTLYGLDWARSAIEAVNTIGAQLKANISGHYFNLFEPDYDVGLDDNSAVLTIGGLEQIGSDSGLFLDYLMSNKPSICLHIEPIIELYDENNLVDFLAIKFHTAKNYLNGFLQLLQQLENEGKIELISVQRGLFGSLFHDGWSIVVWKPLN